MEAVKVIPAIIPTSVQNLREVLAKVIFAKEVQIDVVDGQFVSFVSWPYEPKGLVSEVADCLAAYEVEIDLMVSDPEPAARAWVLAGAKRVIFHVETISAAAVLSFRQTFPQVLVGVSMSNQTDWTYLSEYLPQCDFIQFMGIAEIGTQGQPFDERVVGHVKRAREDWPLLPVAVDGSVNQVTIPTLKAAGVTRFVSGSAIVKAPEPARAYQELLGLASGY